MRRVVLCALVLAGCAPAPVEVELSFPSRDTFLHGEFGRLRVFPVDLSMSDEDCPVILDRVEGGGEAGAPVLDSGWTQICEFRAGNVRFENAPAGPHAYVVQVRNRDNTVILEGCRVGEVYIDAPIIDVQMFPTEGYEDATRGVTLTCATEEDKCRGGC